MASTSNVSNARHGTCRHGGEGEPRNPDLDLNLALTRDISLRRHVLPLHLDDVSPASPNAIDGSQAQWTAGAEADANPVSMQILRQAQQEFSDLRLIYPRAKIQGNRITTEEYKFVLKRLLFNRKVSGDDMSGVPHPLSFARLLERLSRELRLALTGGFKFACTSDPLEDLLEDIQETDGEILEASEETDRHVYVKGNLDFYIDCLLAAASELSTC